MAHETDLAVVSCKQVDDLWSVADGIQSNWNSSIKQNGDYEMTTEGKPSTIQLESGLTKNEAVDQATSKVYSYFDDLSGYDAVLLITSASIKNYDGAAPLASAGESPPPVGVVEENTGALKLHEVGHMYNGVHSQSSKYGWLEYTAMGNPGGSGCDGNSFSDWWLRKPTFAGSCSNGTPNGNRIRSYMQSNL